MSTVLPTDISLNGLNRTRAEEGRSLRAYQDCVGVWTIGYGLTKYDAGLPFKVVRGTTITEQQAEWYLLKSIRENYLPDVLHALQGGTYQHPQGAVDGGVDFHFNTGGVKKATWPRLLGAGRLEQARVSMESWNKAGGRVIADLVRRRATDWAMVSEEKYGHITGPLNVVPNASGRESYHGYGDVLTEFPTDPNQTGSGKIRSHADIPSPATPAPGAIVPGDSGDHVTELQNKLNSAGVPTPVTGTFDKDTESSVKTFQQSHPNLTHDGTVGPATDAALDRAKDMRQTTAQVTKVAAPAIPGGYIAFHQWVSAHSGDVFLTVGLIGVGAVLAYLAWHYRHDITGLVNKWSGRIVP